MEENCSSLERDFINIKEIFFGSSDGKNEAKQEIFLDTFFDHNDIYSKLLNGRYLILGSKGSGKTLLIEYFKKKRYLEGDLFIDIRLEDFFKKKRELESEKRFYDPESLLKWIIYIELSKKLLSLDFIKNNESIVLLEKFMKKNKFDLNLDTNKILEHIEENGIEQNYGINRILSFFKRQDKKTKFKGSIGEYHQYISELEISVKKAIKDTQLKHMIYIIFDELDEIAKKTNYNMEVLSKLVDIFHLLNTQWEEQNIPLKLIISMRKDIYIKLDSVNSGKIYEDYGLILDWGKKMNKKSVLFKLIYHKIRYSHAKYNKLTDTKIHEKLFSNLIIKVHGKDMPIDRYILSKTFLRPRDIITFFNKLKEQSSEKGEINNNLLKAILKDYSSYLLLEVSNEASISISKDEFNEMIKLFKNMRKTIFTYDDLEKYLKKNKQSYIRVNSKNLENILRNFFELGVVGNFKKTNENPKERIYFKYRDDYEMNKEEKFSIHYGIRPALGLSLE